MSSDLRAVSPVDVLMYRGERHPRTRTAMVGVYLLDRVPVWNEFIEHMDQASRRFPRLRERVMEAITPLIDACWVSDPDFDLAYHVRRLHVPAPGSFREVLDLVEASLMAPLDTARPLWEFTLVEGVEGGRAALITKMSHAVTDGMGGMQLQDVLYDTERHPAPRPPVLEPSAVKVTPLDVTNAALRRLPLTAASSVKAVVAETIGTVARVVTRPHHAVARSAEYVMSMGRYLTAAAAPSPLLAGRSNSRRVLWTEVPLDDLKRAAKAVGGTLNDAYLAALAGALARYHDRLDTPVAALSMTIPINRRTAGAGEAGNHWAAVTIAAPTDHGDAATRVRSIGRLMRAARSEPAIDAVGAVAPVLSRLPATVLNGPLADRVPRIDVQASNVPGWPVDTFVCGARVERFLGFGPLPGAAIMAVLISSAGNCTIGVNYDPAAVTDPHLFQACLEEALDEVVALGDEPSS